MFFPAKDISSLKSLLKGQKRIVILTHRNPDGDAMGSSLALSIMLKKLGHDVLVIIPSPFGHFLSWMPEANLALDGGAHPGEANRAIASSEIIFCLDFNNLSRIEELGTAVRKSTAEVVLVDHHTNPEPFAKLNFHKLAVSSTAELIFKLFKDLELDSKIDLPIAECLYTGIMTDTGSFRFDGTTSEVHQIAGTLIEKGLQVSRIHGLIFDNFSEKRMRFLGFCLNKKLCVLPEYRTAYMAISASECAVYDISESDTEGIVNYNLGIENIRFGVLMVERKDKVKLSFRSIGKFPCNKFASHFEGGGHPNASGGQSNLGIAETEKKFLSLLDQFKNELITLP